MGVHRRSATFCLFLCLGASTLSHAGPLQNGDFTSFAGWQGELWDGSSASLVDPSVDSHFSLLGGGLAGLSNDSTFFEVVLFQAFDLPSNALNLSFDFAWDKTDAFDIVQANLIDTLMNLHDLFPATVDTSLLTNSGMAVTDVSSLAGESVTIQFLLSDGDFEETDLFSVGNIEVTPAVVPEPNSVLLFTLGLLVLVGLRKQLRWGH